jgi:hypothetical protein
MESQDEKGGNTMNQIEKCCNMCGKEIKEEAGILKEDCLAVTKQWGYFSRKDGEIHKICLCEDCYDRWIQSFQIPPEVEEKTEYLS